MHSDDTKFEDRAAVAKLKEAARLRLEQTKADLEKASIALDSATAEFEVFNLIDADGNLEAASAVDSADDRFDVAVGKKAKRQA